MPDQKEKKKGTQIVDVVFFCFFKPRAIKAFQQQQPPSVSSLVGWLVGSFSGQVDIPTFTSLSRRIFPTDSGFAP